MWRPANNNSPSRPRANSCTPYEPALPPAAPPAGHRALRHPVRQVLPRREHRHARDAQEVTLGDAARLLQIRLMELRSRQLVGRVEQLEGDAEDEARLSLIVGQCQPSTRCSHRLGCASSRQGSRCDHRPPSATSKWWRRTSAGDCPSTASIVPSTFLASKAPNICSSSDGRSDSVVTRWSHQFRDHGLSTGIGRDCARLRTPVFAVQRASFDIGR